MKNMCVICYYLCLILLSCVVTQNRKEFEFLKELLQRISLSHDSSVKVRGKKTGKYVL